MKSLRFLMLASTLALAGCAGGLTNPFTGAPVTAAQVQAAAVAACGFLPTATTVAGLLTTSAAVQSASQIAGLICSAITPVTQGGARLGGALPTVNGVVIHGKFVGKS